MRIQQIFTVLAACLTGTLVWAAPAMAPAVPDLTLPVEEESVRPAPATSSRQTAQRPAAPAVTRSGMPNEEVVVTNATIDRGGEYVEKITPDLSKLPPLPKMPTEADFAENDTETDPDLVAGKATELGNDTSKGRVVYNPRTDRDPTLSADDTLILKDLQERRRRQKEADRKRKLEEERRRVAEAERLRQLELERLRDPSREIRGKIKVNGIIGREVFIGSKVYKVNDTVLGARIVSVQPDAVVFMYKGQKFTKKVHLQ